MFDHVLVRVSDPVASERFYSAVLAPLSVDSFHPLPAITRWSNLGIIASDAEHAVTQGLHVAFGAPSRSHVDAVWRAGTESGYRDAGAPGPRPEYGDDYYGGFLLDPDGNSVEAVHHDTLASQGLIDHLWLRVRDLAASARFYDAISTQTGFVPVFESETRVCFQGDSGDFSILPGSPLTTGLHIGFAAEADATVDAFHSAAIAAGAPDHGAPGPRPMYTPGYYGAFVLDPDGNNIEVVHFT